ncbi:phytanoyl-CoA dioxygenase family protein [Halomonas binhaiensis]|uniref:Phytanoyl-CoA dioxygenase family protein n=1 Tax=Halomonas binhaiensis TaxID=2562282 RepID=A0A856QWD5_9GAMM|nr:phytanoyl-CoA dioxygenase family protein [Halomonas binhaiensis]QEM84215.2 phytanoyl-CoA dioxygenase family protein [Halomonas binhaiensis]
MTRQPHLIEQDMLDAQAFEQLCMTLTIPVDYPQAERIEAGIPLYSAETARRCISSPRQRRALLDEWHHCLAEGPGVLAITGMLDTAIVDRATETFLKLIEQERDIGNRGDHFATPGSNDRLWNAFQKHGEMDPEGFIDYYANPVLALVAEAWLGPGYQVTSQVNVVRPGGRAQQPHRDYHLGFQSEAQVLRYPLGMQVASQHLTLQGAVAHDDMPLESGPTQLLPWSQRYALGYLAYRDTAFQQVFERHHVQLPLNKGDGLFFNPALFHAAGDNDSDNLRRMANLLQISSAFSRAMESVDHDRLIRTCYPSLRQRFQRDGWNAEMQACADALAEVYPFPANLDRTPPQGGMAPDSQRQLLATALEEDWQEARLHDALARLAQDRQA